MQHVLPENFEEPPLTRKGKIGTLPLELRTELNRRLDDGHRGPELLAWLNADPRVREVLQRHWNGQPINEPNLSDWRRGGYADWRRKCDEIEKLRELSAYAIKLGEAAAGRLGNGSVALAGARIMAEMGAATEGEFIKMLDSLERLRAGDAEETKLALRRESLVQRAQLIELDRLRVQRDSVVLFLKWYEDRRVREVAESAGTDAEKVELLGQAIFGENWRDTAPKPEGGLGKAKGKRGK